MVSDVIAGAFIVTMMTVLLRPGSKGSSFVNAFTSAAVAVISQVTDIADGTDTGPTDGETYDNFNQQYESSYWNQN